MNNGLGERDKEKGENYELRIAHYFRIFALSNNQKTKKYESCCI